MPRSLKEPTDDLELVIVCDMWLTGFDASCLHTMYIDKPMKGHNLMQAIARINRVYFEKQGGLIVDYLGVAQELKNALSFYFQSGGKATLPSINKWRSGFPYCTTKSPIALPPATLRHLPIALKTTAPTVPTVQPIEPLTTLLQA